MGDVLSQNEIDSLLAALSTGEIDVDEMQNADEKVVKNYDFKRPSKFSKDHLRTLEIIYEHYGRLLATQLPVYLRKNVQISVENSEALTFSEFINALANPSILGLVNFKPLPGSIIIDLATNLGYSMIDRMLGGSGTPLTKSREFSQIEIGIIEKILVLAMNLMREPWKSVEDIHPVMERIETNPQFAQVIAPNDMIAVITLNVKIGDVEGFLNICLPYLTLEGIMDRLNTKFWFSTMQKEETQEYQEYIESMLQRVIVPVKTVLGTSKISVNDFMNLQVGDVIKLNTRTDSDLSVYVGNIEKFKALPGASEDAYAVKVTTVIREGE